MNNNRHEGVSGVYGEKVQHRNPDFRERFPGTVVSAHTIVVVEYNDFDGRGPYEMEYDSFDLERSFEPYCGKPSDPDWNLESEDSVCDYRLDFRGNCPNAAHHLPGGAT